MTHKFLFCSAILLSAHNAQAENPHSIDSLLQLPFDKLVDIEVVSATKQAVKLSIAPSSVSSYDYQDIKALGARTLSDIFVLVPGIQVQVKGNNRKKLWVRGIQSEFNNKIALYIDNIPVRNAFNEFSIDEDFPIESVKKIEIIRGPGSALYGANAFAAVINVFTFQPGERKKNTIQYSVGEANTHLGYFSVEKEFENLANVLLEGKGLTTDGRHPDYSLNGEINTRDAQQQLGYVRFKLSALENDLHFSASYSNFQNTRVDKAYPTENDRKHDAMRFSIAYAHQFSNWGIEANSYYTQTQRFEEELKYQAFSTQINEHFDFIDSTELVGFYSALNYTVTENNQLTAGVDIKNERLLNSEFINKQTGITSSFVQPSYAKLSLFDTGLFIQDRQSFWDNKTQLTLGLRFDILELFENQISYRIGLTHAFTPTISAKLLYGTAYRSPSLLEFSRSPVGSALPKVETMRTFEAHLNYHTKTLQTGLTVFHNQYDNFISRKNSFHESAQNLDAGVFANIDNQVVTGLEVESKYIINQHWSSFVNASWSVAKSLRANKALPLLADWTITTGLEWRYTLGFGQIQLNNHLVTYGQRRDWSSELWDLGQVQRYPNRQKNFNAAFVVWNSIFNYQIPIDKRQALDLSLSIHNVLDQHYYTQALTPPNSDKPANFDNQYSGRHIRFGIRYSW